MHKIVYSKQIVKHIANLKSCGLDKKAKEMVEVLRINPFQNPPPYENLMGNLDELYSRRINIKHRMIYQVFRDETNEFDGIIRIINMWSHYENN
ncbi:MAG: Txe/YoeB family addiction module toxin [Mobilitalea sp.]